MKYIFLIFMLTFLFAACSGDDIVEPEIPQTGLEIHTVMNVVADSGRTGETTYFRFADSTIVPAAAASGNNWDLGFKGTTIYTNSGTSGSGNGGALVLTNVDFLTVTQAPSDGYATDAEGAPAIPIGSGNGWYNYDSAIHLVTPIPGNVIIVRTADGKYAKVQILSYYYDMPSDPGTSDAPSRFYSFKYCYQSNGTNIFE